MFVDLEKDKISIIWLHVMSNIMCPNQKHVDGTTLKKPFAQSFSRNKYPIS